MRFLNLVKWIIALALFCGASAVFAEDNSRSLTQISVQDISPTQVMVKLDFDQASPEARVGGDGTSRIMVTLLRTNRGQAAHYEGSTTSLLKDIIFNQEGDMLHMTFVSTSKTRLEITPEGQNRFRVKLTSLEANNSIQGQVNNYGSMGSNNGLPKVIDPPIGEDSYELIPLNYADVSEVVGLLSEGVTVRSNDSFMPREPGFGSPGSNNSNTNITQNQNGPDDKPLGQSVDSSLSIDRRLNAVWVRGTSAHVARVKAQIKEIDVPLTSVFLETEFVELTESGAKNIGIDLTNANGQTGTATIQSGQFIPMGYNNDPSATLKSVSLQAALYAQIQKGEGRIVSKPKISAQSGATAKIITGDALPILTSITLSGVNGVSQQVQYVNVGVTLQIAPRVSRDGYVSSHVFCVVSSVTGYSQGYPTISQREAETSATVKDGEAFVIGGLVQENELKSKATVPILGDIPILGRAFNLDKVTRSKTELYIVITPHIIHQIHAQ